MYWAMVVLLSRQERSTPGWIDILEEKKILASDVDRRAPASFSGRKGDIPMNARMKHPAMIVPDAMQAVLALGAAVKKSGVPERTLTLMQLRASQINGCGYCVDMHARELRVDGDTEDRISAVAAWRDTTYFTDAERAALALTEAATRIADRGDPVDDATWAEAARHFDERSLGALVLNIGLINLWNRLNVTTRQVAAPRAR
jgi:AhpD family alkylhydroperoxidase